MAWQNHMDMVDRRLEENETKTKTLSVLYSETVEILQPHKQKGQDNDYE